jgi:hypothetical protein
MLDERKESDFTAICLVSSILGMKILDSEGIFISCWDKRRSLGQYSVLADSGNGVFSFLF